MMVRVLLGLVALAASGPAGARAPDSTEAALIALERQSWVAWQAMDSRFWQTFLSDDHVEMQGGGPVGKQDVIAGIAGGLCHVSGYGLSDFTFRRFAPDTALLVYRAEQTTTCGGHAVPSPVWATSLYQRRRGHWVNVLYVHSPAAPIRHQAASAQ
jgi:hypothetical protein